MSDVPNHRVFIERLVIALGVVALALLLWSLRGLFMLVFAAVLVAFIFNLIAQPIRERFGIPPPLALVPAVLAVIGLGAAASFLFGAEVGRQAATLQQTLPAAWEAFEFRLDDWGLGNVAREWSAGLERDVLAANFGTIAINVGNGVADLLLVIVGGIYLAAQPALYRAGLLKLIPERGRALAADALDASGRALHLWLLGRLVSMAVVGAMTWLGLTLIGVPSALTLALLAALLEFVPFIGPIVAAVPAVLLALAVGPDKALWTVLLFLIVQQIEGNILEPQVQQRAVSIPPALLLFALVASGIAFGLIGIVLGGPLTVVAYILVKRLYVREALHTKTTLPGENRKA